MRLSSKGRVVVTSLVDMAINSSQDQLVKLSDISKRQNICLPFLEQIFFSLKKNGIFQSIRGLSGGYIFSKKPNFVKLYEVIRAIEEKLKINNCNGSDFGCVSANDKKSKCFIHNLWYEFSNHITSFLTSVSIENVRLNNYLKKNHENMEKSDINH